MSEEKFSSPPPSLPMARIISGCGRAALRAARRAVAGDQRLVHASTGELDAGIGERGQIAQRLIERRPSRRCRARRCAPCDDVRKRRSAFHQLRLARAMRHAARGRARSSRQRPRTAGRFERDAEQFGMTQCRRRDELAAGPHALDALRETRFLQQATARSADPVRAQPSMRSRTAPSIGAGISGTFSLIRKVYGNFCALTLWATRSTRTFSQAAPFIGTRQDRPCEVRRYAQHAGTTQHRRSCHAAARRLL